MKFGKQLLSAVHAAEVAEFVTDSQKWVDYKALKKRLKNMAPSNKPLASVVTNGSNANAHASITSPKTSQRLTLSQSTEEKEFFACLLKELNNVEIAFIELEKAVMAEFYLFLSKISQNDSNALINANSNDPNDSRSEMWKSCVNIHMKLLLLESYGVLNYCAFTKILKKHDKVMGTSTREKYMIKMVEPRKFTNLQAVRDATQKLESMFRLAQEEIGKNKNKTPSTIAANDASPAVETSSTGSEASLIESINDKNGSTKQSSLPTQSKLTDANKLATTSSTQINRSNKVTANKTKKEDDDSDEEDEVDHKSKVNQMNNNSGSNNISNGAINEAQRHAEIVSIHAGVIDRLHSLAQVAEMVSWQESSNNINSSNNNSSIIRNLPNGRTTSPPRSIWMQNESIPVPNHSSPISNASINDKKRDMKSLEIDSDGPSTVPKKQRKTGVDKKI